VFWVRRLSRPIFVFLILLERGVIQRQSTQAVQATPPSELAPKLSRLFGGGQSNPAAAAEVLHRPSAVLF
jgi:hypothetical protein